VVVRREALNPLGFAHFNATAGKGADEQIDGFLGMSPRPLRG
jgi:hypothetical protein